VAFEHRGFHEGVADVIDLHLGIHDALLWIIRKRRVRPEPLQTSFDSPLRSSRERVTASMILRKLGSYPRQNSLALALREVGRIERTLFMLEWLRV
jgi:Tn3 transposase DDE domain